MSRPSDTQPEKIGTGYYSDLDKLKNRLHTHNYSYVTGQTVGGDKHYPNINARTSTYDQTQDDDTLHIADGRPAFKHFKYGYIAGTSHFSEGKASTYGWTRDRQKMMDSQLASAARQTGDLHMMREAAPTAEASPTAGTVPGVNHFFPQGSRAASGLGYGRKHAQHYKYTSANQPPRQCTRARDPASQDLHFQPHNHKQLPVEASAPLVSEPGSKVVPEKSLRLAAGMGYGNTHQVNYTYLNKF
jgi:hypothetical protein